MKVIFIVQGEGRGHLTQALTLEKALRDKGHEVVKILVGKSKAREIPAFFYAKTQAPVVKFDSPSSLGAISLSRNSRSKSRADDKESTTAYINKNPMEVLDSIGFLLMTVFLNHPNHPIGLTLRQGLCLHRGVWW